MAIEGCGVSAFVVWKDETCSEIDEKETRKHFKRLINEIKGWGYLMAGGVEAEIDTTTRAEKRKIIKMAVEEAGGAVPAFCGAHSDSLWEQIEMAKDGKELGVTGVLSVTTAVLSYLLFSVWLQCQFPKGLLRFL